MQEGTEFYRSDIAVAQTRLAEIAVFLLAYFSPSLVPFDHDISLDKKFCEYDDNIR